MRRLPRFARYTGVSVVATVLAQVALALTYGVMRWPVEPAVMFSLVVSVGPAYLLSRRYVWPDTGKPRPAAGEAAGFFVIAFIGAATTIVVVWAAVWIAGNSASDHVTLAVVANSASVVATGLMWVARYIVLDRVLFAKRALDRPVDRPVVV